MKLFLFSLFIISGFHSIGQERLLSKDDSLLFERYKYGWQHSYLYSTTYQHYLDSMLQMKPTNAWYWQQKAMPMFKQKKYVAGMVYLDSAIKYGESQWLDYRAFIKCIFQKSYVASIKDFEKAKSITGFSFVMDHSYDFYMGLCYLQLNKFDLADSLITNSIEWNKQHNKEGHYVEYFYLGIAKLELSDTASAIRMFDESLKIFPQFPDPQYYKALCLCYMKNYSEAKQIMSKGLSDLNAGYTNNEDNNFYEEYPYSQRKMNFESWIKKFNSLAASK